jgi:hypothetical protein
MKWGVQELSLAAATESELHNSLTVNFQGFKLLPKGALRLPPAEVLYQQPHAVVLRERKGVDSCTFTRQVIVGH